MKICQISQNKEFSKYYYNIDIACSTKNPEILKWILKRGKDDVVSRLAAYNPHCPPETLSDVLKRGKNDEVSQNAAENPHCPPEALSEVLKRGNNNMVSRLAAENPNCPVLDKIHWLRAIGEIGIEDPSKGHIVEYDEKPQKEDEDLKKLRELVRGKNLKQYKTAQIIPMVLYHNTNVSPDIILKKGLSRSDISGFTQDWIVDWYKINALPTNSVFLGIQPEKLIEKYGGKYTYAVDISGLNLFPDYPSLESSGAYFEEDGTIWWEGRNGPKSLPPEVYWKDLSVEDVFSVTGTCVVEGPISPDKIKLWKGLDVRKGENKIFNLLKTSKKDNLKKYKEKRDFDVTPEPKNGIEKESKNPIFVLQRHDAKRAHLHYDLRLEDIGVLRSWSVRKGMPEQGKKNLALQTENHPLSYSNFEGTIPEGYGAGEVKIDSKSVYKTIEKSNKKWKFEILSGKYKGKWTLINIGDKRWLLMQGKES